MGVALAWVLLMIAVSLLVIAGINYGNRSQSQKPTAANALVKRAFNWVFFQTLRGDQFCLTSSGLRPPRGGRIPLSLALGRMGRRLDNRRGETPAAVSSAQPDLAPSQELWNQGAIAPSLAASATAIAPHPLPEMAAAIAAQPAAELIVQIEKQVPGFHLQVGFQTTHEPLGLLGASGSGKSMTLRCIAGLDTPSQGRIVLNGRVLFDAHKQINLPSRDRKVGLVFQNYALFPHLTVAQNIAFGMDDVPKPQRVAAVVRYLDQMGLTGLGDRYPHQISGGQQQRVALARALAIQPDILLLDEPLSALDTYLRSHIEKLLIEVLSQYRGITLFITHKLEEAYRVCTNLLVLANGQIQAEGPKADIFEHPPTLEIAKVTECKNFSRVRRLDDHHIEALDWGCRLEVSTPMPSDTGYVGLRAHHVKYPREPRASNTFPGWLAMSTETQHRVTLYIKLHGEPTSPQDYHLQAEIYRDKWESLKRRPFPWQVRLAPHSLITMTQ
ncbi:MAG: sulfate/molybdate ABC transporter ATP-binding protein [Leptolyngbya sp. SIO1E4]|nr:sulfate/molybdate ABC transporter ATP-binding protein [Leptolyngbya sp. SIO1E4]